jgi:hypothetical protein
MRKALLICIFFAFFGCNTAGGKLAANNSPEQMNDKNYRIVFKAESSKDSTNRGFEPKFYALIEKKQTWKVVEISANRLFPQNENQEVLGFNDSLTAVMPVYTSYARSHSEKGVVWAACREDDDRIQNRYHPCNSEFYELDMAGSAITSAFMLPLQVMLLGSKGIGSKNVRSNEDAVVEACRESRLIEKINAFANQADATENALAAVRITPDFQDRTGLFKGKWDQLVYPEMVAAGQDARSDDMGTISLKDVKNCRYDIEVSPRSFAIAPDTRSVRPVITVLAYHPKRWHINRTFANADIALDVKKVSAGESWVRFAYDIRNVSNDSVNVLSKRFYIDDDVANHDFPIQLAPQTRSEEDSLCRQSNMQSVINAPVDITNKDRRFRIAVAINYTVNGQQKTMFAEQYLRLEDMI